MKLSIFCIALLLTTNAFSQSKKELLTQVDQLKNEIETLKKPKEVDLSDTTKIASYVLGTLVAGNFMDQGADSLDFQALTAGMKDVFADDSLKIAQLEGMPILQTYMENAAQKKRSKIIQENAVFLENNRNKEGVVTTPSGLQYKVVTSGKGKMPAATDSVTVHYVGQLIDGTIFDSSVQRNEPVGLQVDGVIPGWTEALQLMREGDKWMLYIPFPLAYGDRGAGSQIPPYSTLIFEVELLKVN